MSAAVSSTRTSTPGVEALADARLGAADAVALCGGAAGGGGAGGCGAGDGGGLRGHGGLAGCVGCGGEGPSPGGWGTAGAPGVEALGGKAVIPDGCVGGVVSGICVSLVVGNCVGGAKAEWYV